MKRFTIKTNNGTVKVLRATRDFKIDGFGLKRGFFAFQDVKSGKFLGFSSGRTVEDCLAVYLPENSRFRMTWLCMADNFDDDYHPSIMEYAVVDFANLFYKNYLAKRGLLEW